MIHLLNQNLVIEIKANYYFSLSFLKKDLTGRSILKAIKIYMGFNSCPQFFKTIVQWFHLLEREQNHGLQDYGL